MNSDLRSRKQRDNFISLYGRLPLKKERLMVRSIMGTYKKKGYLWNEEISLKKLLQVMKIK